MLGFLDISAHLPSNLIARSARKTSTHQFKLSIYRKSLQIQNHSKTLQATNTQLATQLAMEHVASLFPLLFER